MRLYFSSQSKNGIQYTADTLMVGNKRYDIQGEEDIGDNGGLSGRVKGELLIYKIVDGVEDFYKMTDNEILELVKAIQDGDEVRVSVYPFNTENEELVMEDELTDRSGKLCIRTTDGKEHEVDFDFFDEFYGI